jgi:hypothetical protein
MANQNGPDEDKGFKVTDHRAGSDAPHEEDTSADSTHPHPPDDADPSLPALDFTTFILSLSTSVLIHLGEVPTHENTETALNLPLARQTIDLLAVLEQKTKGNLTGEEERLLSHILSELRMRYVHKLKG